MIAVVARELKTCVRHSILCEKILSFSIKNRRFSHAESASIKRRIPLFFLCFGVSYECIYRRRAKKYYKNIK